MGLLSSAAEIAVLRALDRIVKHAFNPPRCRHLRDKLTGKCDVCCQACALEQAREALARADAELEPKADCNAT